VARGVHECGLEVPRLIAERLADVDVAVTGHPHHVVEHRVVAGMVLDDRPHGRHFVGVEDGLEIVGIEHGRQRRWACP